MIQTSKGRLILLIFALAALAALACISPAAAPTATLIVPTAPPATAPHATTPPTDQVTEEPTQHPATQSANVVYQTADNLLMGYISGTGETWNFGGADFQIYPGPNSTVATLDTNIYVLGGPVGEPSQVYLITPVGQQTAYTAETPFVPAGIAVTRDPADPAHPLMAVGEYSPSTDLFHTNLKLLWLDSPQTQIVAEDASANGPYFMPWRWSADSQRLYFSQEPLGLGGYILFDGYTTLSVYDRSTGETTELIPQGAFTQFICLDDISPDETLVAHHCTDDRTLAIRNLQSGEQAAITYPPDIAGEVGAVGSAVFSPDGTRVAYALAHSNPDNEQGWVAVSDGLAGPSHVVMTSEAGAHLVVAGWLDAQTLVVQAYAADGAPSVWLVPLGGGEPQQIGEGQYLAMIPPAG